MISLIPLISLLFFHVAFGARILGVVPTPAFSHQSAFRPLWAELSKRGHEVIVVTTNPVKDKSLTNLTEIDLNSIYDVITKHNFIYKIRHSASNPIGFIKDWTKLLEDVYIDTLEYPDVQELLENESEKFDVVLVEAIYPSMLAFGERFKCPTIGILSFDATFSHHRLMGNPTNPVLFPEFTMPFFGQLSFKERLTSTLYQFFMDYFRSTIMLERDQMILDKYFSNITSKSREQLENSMSMLFVNANPILYPNRPLGPNTVSFGGVYEKHPPKKLPADIEEFLNNATEGAIYFSLGTNVKSEELDDHVQSAILETFKELPYKILWKYGGELKDKPSNLKTAKWLPQPDVLRHPNIKLFITQGGLQSMEDSMLNYVPMIGMPFFGDQVSNIKRMAFKNMGLYLNHRNLTKTEFSEAIYEVIKNPKYREAVKKLVDITEDQPMNGLQKAIWWTEYVIRHKGASHFENPGKRFPLYQQYLVDVFGVLIASALVALVVMYTVLKTLIYGLKKMLNNVKVKNE